MAAPKTARAVSANKGIEMAYRKALVRMVDEMNKSINWWLTARYKAAEGNIIAADASPADDMDRELRTLMRQWQERFDKLSEARATWFAGKVAGYTKSAMAAAYKDAGFTVKLRMSRKLGNMMKAVVAENVGFIKSIPQQHLNDVHGLVMRSVREGRNLNYLSTALADRYDITRRRAIMIARDQNNKATEGLTRIRNQDLGVTEGIWMHRGGGMKPRESHMMMDGIKFSLTEGLYDDDVGDNIMPGELPNCHCTFKPVLPGLAGDSDA